ncbi:class I SAM-dependent methyltransferase [Actinokineospora fastidiosa]|nr:class I SAM-dependent methyltransferase [Actinokineospora fastidiosa]
MEDARALRARMYGEDDLSSVPVFAGGFINYGYWRGIPVDRPISEADRVRSQLALYRLVYADLAGRRVLEVGPGTGVGPGWAFAECGPAELHGVDLHPEQVQRCAERNAAAIAAAGGRFTFRQGAADALPFPDAAVDAVVSVEAAQHFDDLAGFAREAHRVLVDGGVLKVATFFVPDAATVGSLPRLLEPFAEGVDREHPLPAFLDDLAAAGFADIAAESIGEHVWPGLDAWVAQLGQPEGTWPRRYLTAWRDGLLDYFVVTASKLTPASAPADGARPRSG